jgi:ribosome biogenesis GTPase
VGVDGIDWPAGRGAVASLEPRHGLLERPAVANVQRVVVVVALAEPAIDPLQLTRFLLTAECTGCAVQLVFSKADLVAAREVRGWCERVAGWGYSALAVSNQLGSDELLALRQTLSLPGIAVVCGPSGVGKSSLLNALAPDLGLRVGSVSGRLRRGRHTTRHVELFRLPSPAELGAGAAEALLADTPGFNRPDLPQDGTSLAVAFPELRSRLALAGCRFRNCRHLEDPGCAMGTDWPRFALYRQCLAEVEQRAAAAPRAASSQRRRSGRSGQGDQLSRPAQAD